MSLSYPQIVISPGLSYGLLDLVREPGAITLACRSCGESKRYVTAPGRHAEGTLEHADECPVLAAIRAGERGQRRRFRRLLALARQAIEMRESACRN